MKIIFTGTGVFGCPSLTRLIKERPGQIVAIITQPDRPKGRSAQPVPPSIKVLAREHKLEVYQPESINSTEALNHLKSLAPDLIIVAAYGQKLSQDVLSLPHHGCFNLHASLLPQYRGAAPINHALLNGDTKTGVTIFKVELTMDTGAILNQKELEIKPEETATELSSRLAHIGAEATVEAVKLIESGNYKLQKQDESNVSYAPKLTKQDGLIKWSVPAQAIANQIKAMQPWPGTYTFWKRDQNKSALKINITKALAFDRPIEDAKPGQVVNLGKGIEVATDAGSLIIMNLQPAGHKVMEAQAFINGYRIKKGDCFTDAE